VWESQRFKFLAGHFNIVDFARRGGITDALTDSLKTGDQQLIATVVEAELASYLAQFADLGTEAGHAAVVRNGHHPARLLWLPPFKQENYDLY